jgi:hypothetical protein
VALKLVKYVLKRGGGDATINQQVQPKLHFIKPGECKSDIRPVYDLSSGSRELCYMENMVAGTKFYDSIAEHTNKNATYKQK